MVELLTISQVSAALKISRNTAYRMVKEGRIKSVKLSERGTRVARKALEAYMANLEAQQSKPLLNQEKLRRAGRLR